MIKNLMKVQSKIKIKTINFMKLYDRKVKIIIDGKKYTVPFEVYNLINSQREVVEYYSYLLSLWYYKNIIIKANEIKQKQFIIDFSLCLKENISDLDIRLLQLKQNEKYK